MFNHIRHRRLFRYAAFPAAILAIAAGPLTASPASAATAATAATHATAATRATAESAATADSAVTADSAATAATMALSAALTGAASPGATLPGTASPATATTRTATACDSPLGCGPAISATWHWYYPPGWVLPSRTGTITLQGSGFTPGAAVSIQLWTAGGMVPELAVASEPVHFCNELYCGVIPGGSFTLTTQPNIACGTVTNAQNGISGDVAVIAGEPPSGQNEANTTVATACPDLARLL
jgi:hypothetical protein